jgi:hypothetical protein
VLSLAVVALEVHAFGDTEVAMTHRSISSLDFGSKAVWGKGLA